METVVYQLEDLTCPSCIKKIESALGKKKGVSEVTVSFNSSKVKVTLDPIIIDECKIGQMLHQLGYQVLSKKVL